MQNDFLSQKNSIIFLTGLLILLGGVYYFYNQFSTGTVSVSGTMDQGLLNTKIKTFISVKNKIDLKDSSFSKSPFYEDLEDFSEDIPIIVPRGRDNPFIPYVAPGSIR